MNTFLSPEFSQGSLDFLSLGLDDVEELRRGAVIFLVDLVGVDCLEVEVFGFDVGTGDRPTAIAVAPTGQ